MNIFIIYAHHEPKSFNAAMKNCAVETFLQAGHAVQVSDLYAMQFKAIADQQDFGHTAHILQTDPEYYFNYALEQRQAVKKGTLAPDIQAELEKILWADVLIFQFPMYWYSIPAILKGWFDRVLLSGPIYGGKRFYNHGGLVGKKALLAFTLGGRDYMFQENAIHGTMDQLLHPIQQGILGYTGLSVLPPFIGYHVPYLTDAERENILHQYRHYLCDLDTLTPLTMPRLEDFDAHFQKHDSLLNH